MPMSDDTGMDPEEQMPSFRLGKAPEEDFEARDAAEGLRKSLFRLGLACALILLLLCAAAIFAYMGLDRRIRATSESGAGRLQSLSKELSENLSGLSAALAEIRKLREQNDQEQAKRLAELEKAQKAAARDLDSLGREKPGDAEVKKLLDQAMEKTVASMDEKLAIQDKALAELEKGLQNVAQESAQAKRSLADVIENQMSVSSRAEALKKALDDLAQAKADTAFVEKLLAEQKNFYKSQLARSDKDLEPRLSALETQIVSYEAELERLRRALPKAAPAP